MKILNMPLRTAPKWPKHYGFDIVGDGPCYVVNVEKRKVAYGAGLMPGDQILEFDEQDVTNLSSEDIKSLAKNSRTQPPTLGVVARRQQVELVCSRTGGCGFEVHGEKPVRIQHVDQAAPAFVAGLREGDIVLEVNGQSVMRTEDMTDVLQGNLRRLTISIIPVGKQKETGGTVRKVKHKSPTGGSRIQRARNLHNKMNEILGDDYEKKMAVVGVMKQFAEDRDIDILARALAVILKTPQQQRIVRQIRQFIPPRKRYRFDETIRQQQSLSANARPHSGKGDSRGPSNHKHGIVKAVQVVRNGGNFGFVIKGNNPVFIETVDSGGAAERAGLQPGDLIMKLNGIDVKRCGHSHLVQLFQDSGSAPLIEVLRLTEDTDATAGFLGGGTGSVISMSTVSSHASSAWMTTDETHNTDREGDTFKQKAHYLLTSKERSRMKKAMLDYDRSRNIVELFNALSQVMDTPSKKVLWKFILAKLPTAHQEFCVTRINHPQHILMEIVDSSNQNSQMYDKSYGNEVPPPWALKHGTEAWGQTGPHLASFQQQVEYLLTTRERSQLKKALQIYAENRKVENLIQDLEVILDTPSKQTLWIYIIPLLVAEHQEYARHRLNIHQDVKGLPPVGVAAAALRRGREYLSSYSSDDDMPDRTQKPGVKRARGRLWKKMHPGYDLRGGDGTKSIDMALMKELEETRRAVEEAKKIFQAGHKMDADLTDSDDDTGLKSKKYVTVIPISCAEYTGKVMSDEKSRQGKSYQRKRNGVSPVPSDNKNGTQFPPEIVFSSTCSDSDNDVETDVEIDRSRFSIKSGDSFNRRAMTALKELDAAMAAEVSDLDASSTIGQDFLKVTGGSSLLYQHGKPASKSLPPPPPVAPPPPPLPPPPPPPPGVQNGTPSHQSAAGGKMNVKRINWDKLDQTKVENTIWEQLGENDLEDVVKYLELEQHFSTGATKQKISEKRQEVFVLNAKKAYNISILLGHVKMNVNQMKQALFQMDEDILTYELLRQLLAFAPNHQEMEKYDCFDGDLDDLSKPDRFAYEMSRVPGYEQRLKALIFKGNFNEKIAEMKENLQNIRKASAELRHSRKLAKILELILAMGNYMNKGNNRVGGAAGFRISFLAQLDVTKTKDNKMTFIHVLAEAVYSQFPDALSVGEDLTTVPLASKVSNIMLNQELQELRKVLQDVSNTLEKFGSQKTSIGANDRFQDVMGHFISQASDEIQGLFRLQANTMEEFQAMVQFFGEDSKKSTTEIFGIFSEFITKFERGHRHNMVYKRR
ncbi:delphilin-like isoform X2 [Mizuhopecten yessoensis]|uniref:delphilin-like isoform X2 n=1 Tax=Mizuhopecten yessoensis TaxID=6573 RepID=UPI000B45AE79|nr:delphilin-like isoform X2 [Mizuhopecten yessoensis]